jgi:hypothetical protein
MAIVAGVDFGTISAPNAPALQMSCFAVLVTLCACIHGGLNVGMPQKFLLNLHVSSVRECFSIGMFENHTEHLSCARTVTPCKEESS